MGKESIALKVDDTGKVADSIVVSADPDRKETNKSSDGDEPTEEASFKNFWVTRFTRLSPIA